MISQVPLKLDHAIREVTAQVYRQRKLKGRVAFGCAVWVLGLSLAVVVEALAARDLPLLPFFVLSGAALLVSAYQWIWLPVRRRDIDRTDVARFIDAHHPELEDLVLSCVALGDASVGEVSEWMVSQVLLHARALGETSIQTPGVDLAWVRGYRHLFLAISLSGLAAFLVLLVHWSATGIGSRLFSGGSESLFSLHVEPGDVRVRLGDHQLIWVVTDQKNASKAIRWRPVGGQWQTGALEPGQGDGVYAYALQTLLVDTDYQIQIGPHRSVVHRISVWTPPEVVRIDLTYHYPEYLKMSDRQVPHGGDIIAPEGTEVSVDVLVNKEMKTATLALDSGERVDLEPQGSRIWRAAIAVTENSHYRIDLLDLESQEASNLQSYKITAQQDDPPDIRIRFPRGDDEATQIEEVALGFTVTDDNGVFDYGIQYEVAGRDPVRVSLAKSRDRVEKADGVFVLSLEDIHVEPGDYVTWTAWADDGKPGRSDPWQLGDPYFLEIRPFARYYRQAISNGGQSQMQGSGSPGGSPDQKQVIIATWNLRKQAGHLRSKEFQEKKTVIMGAQEAVQTEVEEASAGDSQSLPVIAEMAREIAGALQALSEADPADPDAALLRALGYEMRAYRLILQLKPQESQVSQNRQQQGGQAGSRSAQERELDGLELSQRRDFREEATTLGQQLAQTAQAQNQIEDLSRAQQAINEDIARLITEMESMAEPEREEAKRRLAQLQEAQQRTMSALDEVQGEMASGDMDSQQARQTRERMETAREQMNQSAENLAQDHLQQARTAGNRALGALRDVQEQLTQLSRQAAASRMRYLQSELDSLRSKQDRLIERAEAMQDASSGALSLEPDGNSGDEMVTEKRDMAETFKHLMDEASDLAEKSDQSQGLMSQKLGDWLRETSREGIYEDMVSGDRLVQGRRWASVKTHETGVKEKLDTAAERLGAVAGDLVGDDLDAMARASARIRSLAEEASRTSGDAADMRELATGGFRRWMDGVREAQALLPGGGNTDQQLARIRDGLAGIGRDYQRAAALPQYEMVYDEVIKPLNLVAEELDRAVRARREAFGFSAENADAVPEPYRDHVARYFKALAEWDEAGK
jgi:hypothetical protein